jgi:hypothetical protein
VTAKGNLLLFNDLALDVLAMSRVVEDVIQVIKVD